MSNLSIPTAARSSSLWNKLPWTFLVILYMVGVEVTGADMQGIAGYVFLALCVLVLFLEFFKSGDINQTVFLVDIITSVISVVLGTALLSYFFWVLQRPPTFFHWFGAAIILGDAILSPFNSFRTALRNFGLGT